MTERALPPLATSSAEPPPLSTAALLTLLTGAFLPIAAFFVVNVALPAIGRDLSASPAQLQLVVGSYGIANATLVVVGGRLGDGYGRRRLFLLGMSGFTVFSLLCGIAPTIELLLACRVGLGAFAALMTPQVLATIAATLTGEHRVRAIGLFGAVGGMASAFGQIAGGLIVSADIAGLGWRAVFLINLPVCLVGMIVAWRILPETRAHIRLPVDAVGAAMLATVLVMLLLPLTEGRPLGWPTWSWSLLLCVVPLAAILVLHQRRVERSGRIALVPPSVLKHRSLRIGLLIAVAFFTSVGGFLFVFAIATQGEAGFTPFEGGLALVPLAASSLGLSPFIPRLQRRYGNTIIARGWAILAVGYSFLAAILWLNWPYLSPMLLFAPMLVIGIGQGLVMMPLFNVVLGTVPQQQAGLGSGILITTQQTCASLGAATVGTAYLAMMGTSLGEGNAFAIVAIAIAVISVLSIPMSLGLARPPRTTLQV